MRVFLSHSSSDKLSYVNYISEHLNSDDVIIDEFNFVRGMPSKEEMIRNIEQCDIFVFFISEESLMSNYVKFEIDKFEECGGLQKKLFVPIIIQENIKYHDERIRDWMRDYNLKKVSQPSKALALINEVIRIRTWNKYGFIKEKEAIFIGRNEYVDRFERRYYERMAGKVIAYSVSGFEKIGRGALLSHCLKKVNKCRPTYDFPKITLNSIQSIEDFIFQIASLGVAPLPHIDNLMDIPLEEKIEIAKTLLTSFYEHDDVIHIIDNGCIVRNDGNISKWFEDILHKIDNKIHGVKLILSSRYRYMGMPNPKFWNSSIAELTPDERNWLLSRYLDLYKIILTDEQFKTALNWLQGYPEQIFYLADTINNLGFDRTRDNSKRIVDYSLNRTSAILEKYMDNPDFVSFFATMAKIEMIKFDTLISIFGEQYKDFILELLLLSICTSEGISKEYIRLSETVRDYINRRRLTLNELAMNKIREEVVRNFQADNQEIPDPSDLYFIAKESILSKSDISKKFIFPSHFSACMKEIYNKRGNDDEVITIARLLLSKESTIDRELLQTARYYLCLALARKKDHIVLREVSHLTNNSDKHFIKGFYFRLTGNSHDAIKELKEALKHNSEHKRAKRELVAAYIRIEEFDTAFDLAKDCFYDDQSNIYFSQAYFKCLRAKYMNCRTELYKKEMEKILESQVIQGDERDQNMLATMKAEYSYFVVGDKEGAYKILASCNEEYGETIYTMITAFSIAENSHDIPIMQEISEKIKVTIRHENRFEDIVVINQILIQAHLGEFEKASKIIDSLGGKYSDLFKQKQRDKITKVKEKFFNHL